MSPELELARHAPVSSHIPDEHVLCAQQRSYPHSPDSHFHPSSSEQIEPAAIPLTHEIALESSAPGPTKMCRYSEELHMSKFAHIPSRYVSLPPGMIETSNSPKVTAL